MKSLIVICALLTLTLVIRERRHTPIPVAPIPVCPAPPVHPREWVHGTPPPWFKHDYRTFTCNTQPARGNTDNG